MKEKTVQIHFRATEKERRAFQRNAAKCGMSLSAYLRALAIGHEPKALPPIQYGKLVSVLSELYYEFQRQGKSETEEQIVHLITRLTEAISPGTGGGNGDNENLAGS